MDKEKSKSKSKRGKNQKMESKKEFKTLIFELVIVDIILMPFDIILMPFFIIFLLLWLSSMSFLFYFIFLEIMILIGILDLLMITNKISIIKSKSRENIEWYN